MATGAGLEARDGRRAGACDGLQRWCPPGLKRVGMAFTLNRCALQLIMRACFGACSSRWTVSHFNWTRSGVEISGVHTAAPW